MEAFFDNLFFTVLVLLTVVPAFLVVLTLNIVRAACWLLLSLSGVAGLFFYLGADFVGATQLLIYVGGTLVLVIFGVMLTATGPFIRMQGRSGDWALAILAGFALFGIIAFGIAFTPWDNGELFPVAQASAPLEPTTTKIGMAFLGMPEAAALRAGDPPAEGAVLTGYLLPFEIVSVHLVVVLIGAAYLARAKQRRMVRGA